MHAFDQLVHKLQSNWEYFLSLRPSSIESKLISAVFLYLFIALVILNDCEATIYTYIYIWSEKHLSLLVSNLRSDNQCPRPVGKGLRIWRRESWWRLEILSLLWIFHIFGLVMDFPYGYGVMDFQFSNIYMYLFTYIYVQT